MQQSKILIIMILLLILNMSLTDFFLVNLSTGPTEKSRARTNPRHSQPVGQMNNFLTLHLLFVVEADTNTCIESFKNVNLYTVS